MLAASYSRRKSPVKRGIDWATKRARIIKIVGPECKELFVNSEKEYPLRQPLEKPFTLAKGRANPSYIVRDKGTL